MKCRTIISICLLFSLFTSPGLAEDKRPFTVEDLWNMQWVSSPVMSPDGTWLAVTVSTFDMVENTGSSDIWLLKTDGTVVRRLTTHEKSDSSPAWSPDSKRIVFVSSRAEGASQLFIIPIDGGEARQLSSIPTGAGSPTWGPMGNTIYFISSVWPDCETDECLQKHLDEQKESKIAAHVTDQTLFRYWNRYVTDGRMPMLFAIDVETGMHTNIMRKSGLTFGIRGAGSGSYAISPAGDEIALVINNVENEGLDYNSDIFIMPAQGGEAVNITDDNEGGDGSPVYSPDGAFIAYTHDTQPMVPEYARLAIHDRSTGENKTLTEGWEYSVDGHQWSADGSTIYFSAGVHGRSPIFSISASGGEVNTLIEGHTMSGVQVAGDSTRLYFSRQAFSLPPTVFASDLNGENEVQLSHFNDELVEDIAWHSVEVHSFTGAEGDTVEMFVLKPYNFDPDKKWPLVHLLHGGPHGAWMDSFHPRWNAQLFGAPGYVVTAMNFHGSSTYGQDFYDSIAGREADKPFADTMAATDYMLAQGYIDENRMAAGGGSYGGYLTNWVATQTERFAALFTHAGGFNHWGMWASDGPRSRERRWGGYPWLVEENVLEQSPNVFAENITTPMLVIHGELDYRVVVTQGIELYNTLQILGVPSRLIIYPDEGHWIGKPQNARLWWNEIHAWLARYIGS